MGAAESTDNKGQLFKYFCRLAAEKSQFNGFKSGEGSPQRCYQGPDFKFFSKFQQGMVRRVLLKEKSAKGTKDTSPQDDTQGNKKRGNHGRPQDSDHKLYPF